MPVSIGFLRGCSAAQTQPTLTQTDVRRTCTPSGKTAHIHSRPDAAVPICRDRHNSATGDFGAVLGDGRYRRPAAVTGNKGRGNQRRESQGKRLPKSWANAGAFSLLTPKSKLAQY